MVARDGRQSELTTKAFWNTKPSRAMRSMLGVFRMVFPAKLNSSKRRPSPRKKTMLGLAGFAANEAALRSTNPRENLGYPRQTVLCEASMQHDDGITLRWPPSRLLAAAPPHYHFRLPPASPGNRDTPPLPG